jgi:tripartite-type tricarboxylate transporter receptor subunit TctC
MTASSQICRRSAWIALAGLASFVLAPSPALAQGKFPSRAIRIVSPFAAGSVSDISMRLFADRLAARLNGQVVVDNQPRAGGVTAAAAVLSSPPDGYTVALFSTSTAISASLFKQLPYDPVRDFLPVSMFSTFANVLATGAGSKYATLGDVIAAARARPGALNIGTTTVGSTNHLAATLFKAMVGLDVVIVPYRTPGDLMTAALRNDVDVIVQSYGALKVALEDRQLRPLATTTPGRAAYLPDVPSVQEAGVSGFDVVT